MRTCRVTPLAESIRSMEDVMHIQASPDGDHLAFEAATGILVARAEGTEKRYLALGSAPSWSPDGTKIVFAAGFAGSLVDVAT
ncbi:MAG TPA: hypothetical protein VH989_04365 [Actinomycetota bacterium]